MNKNSSYLFYTLISLVLLLITEVVYLYSTKTTSKDMFNKKIAFVNLCKLPDLAISTEATYIRHRSLSDIFSIYRDDGTLREYFPTTFVISHSHIINKKDNIAKK